MNKNQDESSISIGSLDVRDIFPVSHRLQKTELSPVKYFNYIIEYLKSDQHLSQILFSQQVQGIKQMLNKLQRYKFSFYEDFLSVIILWKEKAFMRSKLTLLYMQEMKSKVMTNGNETFEYLDQPSSFNIFNLGELDYNPDFQKEKQQLEQNIQKYLQMLKGKKNKTIKYSPGFLKNLIQNFRELNTIQNIPKDNKNENNDPISNIKLSDQGTPDYHQTRRPNSNRLLCQMLINQLTKDQQCAKMIQFSFRMKVLENNILKIQDFNRKKIGIVKDCLQQLFIQYKKIINQKIQIKHQYIKKYFDNCNKKIDKIIKKGFSATPKIIKNSQLAQSVNRQLENWKPVQLNQILNFNNTNHSYNPRTTDLGFTNSIEIDQECLFGSLLQLKEKLQDELTQGTHFWILIVEREFKKLAKNLLDQQFLQNIQMEQIYCKGNKQSNLHNVILNYETIMTELPQNINYTHHLQEQCYSHVYLIKYIAAAFALQRYKAQHQNSSINLNDYTVPLKNLAALKNNFTSMSYSMRRSLYYMNIYAQANQQNSAFCQLGNKNSYEQYLSRIFDHSQLCKQQLINKNNAFQQRLSQLKKDFDNFQKKYNQCLNIQKDLLQTQSRQCSTNCITKKQSYYYIQLCSICKKLEDANSKVQNCKSQKFNSIQADLFDSKLDQKCWIAFKFLDKTSLCGVMKLIYQSQISITNKKDSSFVAYDNKNNIKTIQFLPLKITCKTQRQSTFLYSQHYNKQPNNFAYYDNSISHSYNSQTVNQPINNNFFTSSKIASFDWLFKKPLINDPIRQHKIYSSFQQKKKCNVRQLKNMPRDKYIDFASLKISPFTQIPLLCYGIQNRRIVINTIQQQHQLVRYLILSTAADAKAYQKCQRNQSQIDSTCPIIQESIRSLLINYSDGWRYQDFYSLQIFGVVFSLFSHLIKEPSLAVNIARKAFNQYEKIKEETANYNDLDTKIKQLYFIRSIISCFSQNCCASSSEACIILAKLIVINNLNNKFRYRLSKSIFKKLVENNEGYKNRAILVNIQSLVRYFKLHLDCITQIVRQIDKSINSNTKWQFIEDLNYVFRGIDGDQQYTINFFTGVVIKNGCASNQLPLKVRKNKFIFSIFNNNSDMEILVTKRGIARTIQDYGQYFPQQKKTLVFFEFSFNEIELNKKDESQLQSLRIRMIMKEGNKGKQKIYLLIPPSVLYSCKLYIPYVYLNDYFCWLQEQSGALIFRKKSINCINQIGLILKSDNNLKKQKSKKQMNLQQNFTIYEGRIIQKQFINQPLSFLLSPQTSNQFIKLFTVKKQQRINKAIQILSSIQLPQYIVQIQSKIYTKSIIQFWLIRSNIKFIFSQQLGLVSKDYQNYVVSQQYCHHILLPWSQSDNVRCLCLKKIENNLRASINHNNCILFPRHQICVNGKIELPKQYKCSNNIINYEIHDNFEDIRSQNRSGQLCMAALICSFEGKICWKTLMITNEEYAIGLIRTCYNNIQITSFDQYRILDNIMRLCNQLNLNNLFLCCNVLFKISKYLTYILPNKQGRFYGLQQFYNNEASQLQQDHKKMISSCCQIYLNKIKEGVVSCESRLSQLQLHLLGIDPQLINTIQKKKRKQCWERNESVTIKIQQKYIKSIQTIINTYNKALKDINHLKKTIFNFFQKKQLAKEQQPQSKINIIQLNEQNDMAKEMNFDLKMSYQSFLRYNQKYQKIQLSQKKTIQLLISLITGPKQKCQKLKLQLDQKIKNIFKKYQSHLQFIFRLKVRLTKRHYVDLLCDKQKLKSLYSNMSLQDGAVLKDAVIHWLLITLQIQSFNRIIYILNNNPNDKIALFRELQSPRQQITKKIYWICFQAQMKIRIWKSQYDTYEHLRTKGNGSVSQLNMGQGKTQVIIPMLVLQQIYEDSLKIKRIPRINILVSLLIEAERNYFRFFSTTSFKISCFSFKFDREVTVTIEHINRIKEALHLFKNKGFILMDRDSCLSMTLKIREEYLNQDNTAIKSIGNTRDQWILDEVATFDIFDEVDAMMTPKKYFVYSIGSCKPLQNDMVRYEIARVVLQIICKQLLSWLYQENIASAQQNLQRCQQMVTEGSYPKGLRILSSISKSQKMYFRQKIALNMLMNQKYLISQFKFYQHLQQKHKIYLLKYLIDQTQSDIASIRNHLPEDINAILALRGLLAFGVVQHCLTQRVGVDFGVPNYSHHKRVGVPYQAANVPSLRSQYAHPDIAIIVSYIAYYTQGITYDQFVEQLLPNLMEKSQSSQNYHYSLWLQTINKKQLLPIFAMSTRQINMDSTTQLKHLHKVFQYCRSTMVYWLINCVFKDDLKQYEQSICSSSWDIAHVQQSVGFSGTKDNRWLLPQKLTWHPSNNDSINGTDGNMIHRLLHHTRAIQPISDGDSSLWQRFCLNVLQMIKNNVACIIDAGAILAGKSLEDQVVPWICAHPLFGGSKFFRGITFCDKTGSWKVYDAITQYIIQRGSSIPQKDTFVIFDQARTRGADIKMETNVKAVLSLSPNMTKDKLMQAAGRLRQLGRGQELYIMSTRQILRNIKSLKKLEIKEQVRELISWCCQNSLNQNRTLLLPNSKLALIHYKTVITGQPQIQYFKTSLHDMYSGSLTEQSIYLFHSQTLSNYSQDIVNHGQVRRFNQKMKQYGHNHFSKGSSLNDTCQRQTQRQIQIQNIQQKQNNQVQPIPEENKIQFYKQSISTIAFKFNQKLRFSKNFIKCTSLNMGLFGGQNSQSQLCKINYVCISQNHMLVITQMQANTLLSEKIANCGPYSIQTALPPTGKYILCRFADLNLQLQIIKKHRLQAALVHAQFFNGYANFQDTSYIFDLISDYKKQQIKIQLNAKQSINLSSNTNNMLANKNGPLFGSSNLFGAPNQPLLFFNAAEKKNIQIDELVCHFLNRRNNLQAKYFNSDLQSIAIQLKNQPIDSWKINQFIL